MQKLNPVGYAYGTKGINHPFTNLDTSPKFDKNFFLSFSTGKITVFAVNHGRTYWDNESVEVFSYDDKSKTLRHVRSVRDPKFRRYVQEMPKIEKRTDYIFLADFVLFNNYRRYQKTGKQC